MGVDTTHLFRQKYTLLASRVVDGQLEVECTCRVIFLGLGIGEGTVDIQDGGLWLDACKELICG